ncbi:hypothetical protein DAMA08_027600 [Martiniozyma asiatica (nom. inval.)]|nr:hypothetical protein DAMA08_027600 [Martiniozyma asiatica]
MLPINQSIYAIRSRFICQKGFEVEDDMEFCPQIVTAAAIEAMDNNSIPNNASMTGIVNNSNLSGDANPNNSPLAQTAISRSATPVGGSSTPRVKKVLEIVNPHTGMRLSMNN